MAVWFGSVASSIATTLITAVAVSWLVCTWLKKKLDAAVKAQYDAELDALKIRLRATEEALKATQSDVSANTSAVREALFAAHPKRGIGLPEIIAGALRKYASKHCISLGIETCLQQNPQAPCSIDSTARARLEHNYYDSLERRIAYLENNRTNSNNTTNFLTGIIAFITLCGVAVSFFQWKTTQNFFYKDQRPYVMVNAEPFPLISKHPIVVNLYSGNAGKSPAVKVSGDGRIFWGDDALKQADRWFDNEPYRVNDKTQATIPPSVSASGHGDRIHATLSTERVFSDEELDALTGKDFSIVIAYREIYEDAFGNTYKTDVCVAYLVSHAIADCPQHNSIE